MSTDKSSLSTDVHHDEPSQTVNTPINDQDIKKDDLATTSSTTPETTTSQAPDSDVSKHATAISTHDSDANKHATEISTPESQNTSPPEIKPTSVTETSTPQIPDSDANKQANAITTHETSNQDSSNPPTVDGDARKDTDQSTQTTSTDLQTNKDDHGNPSPTAEPSTSQIPDSDVTHDSIDQTNPPTVDDDAKISADQSTKTTSTDLQTNQDDHDNPLPTAEPSTSQVPDAIATHDSAKSSTPVVPTSNQDSNSADQTNPPTIDNDTKQAPNQSTQTNKDDHGNQLPPAEPSTSQIPDSDANKQASTTATHDSVDQTNPPTVDDDAKISADQSTQTTSTDLQTNQDDHDHPLPTAEPSTSQFPDAIATHDSAKSSTPVVPTSNQDSNSDDQTNPPTIDNDTKQAPNQSTQTNKDDHGNQLPPAEPSMSQIPDSDANKQASTTATHDSVDQTNPPTVDDDAKISADQSTQTTSTDLQTNQDDHDHPSPTAEPSTSQVPDAIATHDSVDQTDSPTTDGVSKKATDLSAETDSTSSKTDKITPPSSITSNEERKQLINLIGQELKFVQEICPKLGKHEKRIENEAKSASEMYHKLKDEPCELKELKDLKKIVTKLKLQIPARYRTYDESDKKKNLQSGVENGGIPSKLLKKLPRLHDKLFHQSPICKAIQLRFNKLRCELKLCLLCFSVFPEKAIIRRRSVIYWWIGEGLIPREDDLESGRTVEDYANDFFEELMDKGFIEPAVSKSYGRYVALCKMHPMVRAALVMIADEVRFFDFDEYGEPKDFGKFDEIESPEDLPRFHPLGDPREFFDFYDENKNLLDQEQIDFFDREGNPYQFAVLDQDSSAAHADRDGKPTDPPVDRDGKEIDTNKKHYYYRRKSIITKSFKVCLMGSGLSKGITWEKLHLLFNVKDDVLAFKPEWFLRMKNINVLFLGRWQSSAAHHIEVDEFEFDKSLDNMSHVRFFSLQGVSRVSKLPDSISKLKSLLILDLRACHNLEVIPETIGSLKCLTHLDISECYLLKNIPKEISLLESLQVLKGFVVVESPGRDVCTLQDLKKLENLRKLSMYTHMKDFPQESHLDALQKLETLRKLTILWGGHESNTPKTNKSKQDVADKKKQNLASKVMRLIPKKQWVQGSFRRMNAFSNSTLGVRLEKLDLKCFPHRETPDWLTARNLTGLKKLYIRGGCFSDLGQYLDIQQWDESPFEQKETWNVEILRLKYLEELKMEWKELQDLFPKLTSLEKVKCPRLTLFPCDEHGVWNSGLRKDQLRADS